MTTDDVLSQSAEDSCMLINHSLADHSLKITWRDAHQNNDRFRIGRSQRHNHAVFIRIVSITEAFACGQAVAITDQWAGSSNHEFAKLWRSSVDRELATWVGIGKLYKQTLKINLNDAEIKDLWTQVNNYIEARNSIVHGLGELTRRQRSGNEKALRDRLIKVGIRVDPNGFLEISDEVVWQLATSCKEFVRTLDGKLRARQNG